VSEYIVSQQLKELIMNEYLASGDYKTLVTLVKQILSCLILSEVFITVYIKVKYYFYINNMMNSAC